LTLLAAVLLLRLHWGVVPVVALLAGLGVVRNLIL
jgi:hypothetical protein